MMTALTENVKWVGKVDWELKFFHGQEYSTHRGSSYNSYLIKDQKTVLIDTVWKPFAREFIENLKQEIELEQIDYIIANHAESDHSGALELLMQEIPETPIYCTKNAIQSLQGHYHKTWNFIPVKTGDTLNLGKNQLVFVEARMLHWPDSMFTYLTGENLLFSNDAFGQHYASELLYNDLVDQSELEQEAIKYYANILTPYSVLVQKKIEEIKGLNLPLDMICPSHGIIWRKKPWQIVEQYLEWAQDYQENQITLVYDSMWDGTKKMAEAIIEGIKTADDQVNVKMYNLALSDKSDIITEIFKSKAFLIGSPTINRGILYSVAGLLEMIKGLGFKNKKAAAFGCYGWSGEGTKIITEGLMQGGITILDEGLRALWHPDQETIQTCKAYGKDLVAKI
ncbi:anaerobic nitric oxide reductase flavorubredoxin [Natronospira sp.]|uniref:anaerobic nitric oxide reductase flavorubredoxin n=1 Tax=Natronospira sp. TaxID=2024970 RepID=UPI0038732ECF